MTGQHEPLCNPEVKSGASVKSGVPEW